MLILAACGPSGPPADLDAAAFSGGEAEAPACLLELEEAAARAPAAPAVDASTRSAVARTPGHEVAAFGMGCFWGAEVLYGALPGVGRTSVGYAGGTGDDPTYYDIADHIETVLVEYDPAEISYEELLEHFWAGHDPGLNPWMNQYRSMIFPVTDAQAEAARGALAAEREDRMRAVLTEVRRIERFYPDLSYHDKYYLRNHEVLWRAVVDAFGTPEAALASTAAARLNALVAGRGSQAAVAVALSRAADAGEISTRAEAELLSMVPEGR